MTGAPQHITHPAEVSYLVASASILAKPSLVTLRWSHQASNCRQSHSIVDRIIWDPHHFCGNTQMVSLTILTIWLLYDCYTDYMFAEFQKASIHMKNDPPKMDKFQAFPWIGGSLKMRDKPDISRSPKFGIPSGKRLHNHGKSPFFMGKSTISMAMFNSFLYVYQRVHTSHSPCLGNLTTLFQMFSTNNCWGLVPFWQNLFTLF